MNKLIATLVATTLLAGSAVAQTPAASSAAPKLMADPALWVVKDADTTIYLLGTVHVLKPGTEWLDGGVKKAYDASSEIVLELLQPDTATMQGLIGKYAVDPDGPALTAKLSPEVKALYEKTTSELGLPAPAFEKFQPWFVSTILSLTAITKAGYDPESGVERQITAAASRDGKKLAGLETAEQQIGFFASLPEEAQLKFLKSTLEELAKVDSMFNEMVADWAKGDPDALARLLNASMNDSPEVVKVLLTDRNARWAEWIDKRLATPGTIFIAVGAGHLAGSNSVQEFLKARKLKAVRIPS
jgi:uncharacterized protein YbaP (TraB family)